MDRREMLTGGFRYLARVLPDIVATAGSLGFLRHKPEGPVVDSQPGCFPAQKEAIIQPTPTPCQRRRKNGNKPP
jgi:hypothetical protein